MNSAKMTLCDVTIHCQMCSHLTDDQRPDRQRVHSASRKTPKPGPMATQQAEAEQDKRSRRPDETSCSGEHHSSPISSGHQLTDASADGRDATDVGQTVDINSTGPTVDVPGRLEDNCCPISV